jgi:hypothetical protein
MDGGEGPWRHPSNQLVTAMHLRPWPQRCARCNGTDVQEHPTVVRLSHLPMFLYVFLFFGIIWFFIGSYFLRKSVRLPVHLCRDHARERLLWRYGKPIGGMLALSLCIVVFGATSSELALFAMLALLLAWLVTPAEPLRAKNIVGGRVDILGVDPQFAAQLPLWRADQLEALMGDVPDLD